MISPELLQVKRRLCSGTRDATHLVTPVGMCDQPVSTSKLVQVLYNTMLLQ
jgi:hypothetical protein